MHHARMPMDSRLLVRPPVPPRRCPFSGTHSPATGSPLKGGTNVSQRKVQATA